MIDPTSFESIGSAADSKINAQYWLLFSILVANKPAEITTQKLKGMLASLAGNTPFDKVKSALDSGVLRKTLEEFRTGQYIRILSAFTAVVSDAFPSDPRKASLEVLERVPGIGPKTSRWFYLLIHPEAKVAALDTHVLKFLRDQNAANVPKSTPPKGRLYAALETVFVETAERLGMKPRDLDFFVWAVYRNNGKVIFSSP